MSLGPFELLGANPGNPHGHFEAIPPLMLNRELMEQAFGFPDDYTVSQEIIDRFIRSEGRWPADINIADRQYQRAKEIIHQLIASGPVSGFKDPRTVLTWPFWLRVFQEFPGLKVVALCLIRSPHEIAMSHYRRARGIYSYNLVLDSATLHMARLKDIVDGWQGDHAILQFDPMIYPRQAQQAVERCGLKWDAAAFAEVYDADCRHYRPTRIAHASQVVFEQLGGLVRQLSEEENLRNLMIDAAEREQILRDRCSHLTAMESENHTLKKEVASFAEKMNLVASEKGMTQVQLYNVAAERSASLARLKALEAEKMVWDRYRQSRGWALLVAAWRLRQKLLPTGSRREAAAKGIVQVLRAIYRCMRHVGLCIALASGAQIDRTRRPKVITCRLASNRNSSCEFHARRSVMEKPAAENIAVNSFSEQSVNHPE
jgi:hypothetical protein